MLPPGVLAPAKGYTKVTPALHPRSLRRLPRLLLIRRVERGVARRALDQRHGLDLALADLDAPLLNCRQVVHHQPI